MSKLNELRKEVDAYAKTRRLDDLADAPRWVAWRTDKLKRQDGTAYRTKVPYSPTTGGKAAIPTKPNTYGTKAEAQQRWRKLDNGDPGGIGIVLGDLDGVCLMGIDLDNCLDEKTDDIAAWANAILERFNTYAEISPSGTGIKAFFLVAPEDVAAANRLFVDHTGKERKRVAFVVGEHREIALDRARFYAVTGDREGPATFRVVPLDDLRWFLEVAGPEFKQAHGTKSKKSSNTRDESGSGYGWRFMRDQKASGAPYEMAKAALLADTGPAGEWARRSSERDWRRTWEAVPTPPVKGYEMVRAADVIIRRLDWLWPGHLLRGAQELTTGVKGLGKSQLQCHIAACVTTGRAFPDGAKGVESGNVIMVGCEDTLDQVVVPRLIAAGAALDRVFFLKAIRQDAARRMFLLGEDLDQLGAMITEIGNVALVAIDPITAFMGKINSHNTSDVRGQLGPLAELAGRFSVAVSTVTHPPKAGGQRAMDHFVGSQAFLTAARIGHLCYPETKLDVNGVVERTGRNLFTVAGTNHQMMASLAYCIEPETVMSVFPREPKRTVAGVLARANLCEVETSRIRWCGAVDITADEAIASASTGKVARTEKIDDFVRAALEAGPVPAADMYKKGAEHGFTQQQLKDAKKRLGIESEKQGLSGWVWTAPPGTKEE